MRNSSNNGNAGGGLIHPIHNFIGSACFVARLIEEIKPIFFLGLDRCNFEWIKKYELISGGG
jgi:hypothetical protein